MSPPEPDSSAHPSADPSPVGTATRLRDAWDGILRTMRRGMSSISVWASRMRRVLLEHASAVTVAAALILMFNGVALIFGFQMVRDRNQSADRGRAALAQVNEVAWILGQTAASVQNYVATDDQGSLQVYHTLHARLPTAMSRVQTLTADDPTQRRLFVSLRPLTLSLIDTCERAIALEQAKQTSQALQLMTSTRYVGTVTAIGSLMPQMIAAEEHLISGRVASARAAEQMAFLLMALATIVNVAVLIVAFDILRQAMELRQQTAIARAKAEAQVQVLALEASHQRMSEFVATASHEIRTPLTSTKLGITLAMHRLARLTADASVRVIAVGEVAKLREPFETANQQLARLVRLVNNLFDLTRLREGRLVKRSSSCDLIQIAHECVEEQKSLEPRRVISMVAPADMSGLPILADPDLIGQVVTNYLANALKYSAPDQPVRVLAERQAREAKLSVTDEGPGLSPEARERVWERFYRAEEVQVSSGSEVGLGLGLYISQQIIEQHGGRVGVESELGHGSTFWFALPLAPITGSIPSAPEVSTGSSPVAVER